MKTEVNYRKYSSYLIVRNTLRHFKSLFLFFLISFIILSRFINNLIFLIFFQRERNSSMNSYGNSKQSSSPRQNNKTTNNFGRQRATSSPVQPSQQQMSDSQHHQYYGKKEKGIVEKLLNSYGFVECSTTGNRVFFHYSEFEGDPNHLQVGGKTCLLFMSMFIFFLASKKIAYMISEYQPEIIISWISTL